MEVLLIFIISFESEPAEHKNSIIPKTATDAISKTFFFVYLVKILFTLSPIPEFQFFQVIQKPVHSSLQIIKEQIMYQRQNKHYRIVEAGMENYFEINVLL